MSQFARFREIIKPYVPLILRVGLGVVFLWSGLSKFGVDNNPLGICTNRTEAIDFASTLGWLPINPDLFVTVQSIAELILGTMLVVGLWTEVAAAISVAMYALFFAMFDFSLIWKNVGLFTDSIAILGMDDALLSLS